MIIFILSHNRVNDCPTLTMLNKLNYNGDYKIVVDDKDNQLNEYKSKYLTNLLIFNKDAYLYKNDIGYGRDKIIKESPFYARMYIDEYAKENNLGNYIVMDDDIKNLKIRYPNYIENKLPTYRINDFNKLLECLFDFMNNENIYALSFAHQGMFIGGINSFNEEKILSKRVASNIFLFNSNRQLNWKTIFYDDFNTCISNGKLGKLIFTIPYICTETELQGGQLIKQNKVKDNGMGLAYKNTTQFERSLFSVLIEPSCCKLKEVKTSNNWWASLNVDNTFPKIISSYYKKRW